MTLALAPPRVFVLRNLAQNLRRPHEISVPSQFLGPLVTNRASMIPEHDREAIAAAIELLRAAYTPPPTANSVLSPLSIIVANQRRSEGVKRLWDELPAFFDLPSWELLAD
ncbi:hypothetical protein C8R47DRAFT_1319266 [Mycena vitilis]|nr:hypothetical protein C8R47DRAFT_1319266 [Mycena vitilis]